MSEVGHSAREMFELHARSLHAYAARRVGREEASDVVAETFRRAIESAQRFDPALGTERSWLFGIATNVLRRHRRTEVRKLAALARHDRVDHGAIDPLLATAPRIDAARDLARVLEAVAALDVADYELLVLVAWEGLAVNEAAEVLGVPAGTARSRLHRIRKTLELARTNDQEGSR